MNTGIFREGSSVLFDSGFLFVFLVFQSYWFDLGLILFALLVWLSSLAALSVS